MLHGFAERYVADPWLCWGVGPALVVFLVFIPINLLFDWLAVQPWMKPYLLTYTRNEDRPALVKAVQRDSVSWWDQLERTCWINGLMMILSTVLSRYLFDMVVGEVSHPLPSLRQFFSHFMIIILISEFITYWTHRWCHENEWMWKNIHREHHLITTPTSLSTSYTTSEDGSLTAGLPLTIACLAVRPHPVTFLVIVGHLGMSAVVSHNGMECWWINLLTLRFLNPLHAPICHHDSHHRFGGRMGACMNYGSHIVLWDWVFGTLSDKSALTKLQKSQAPAGSSETLSP